MATIESRTGADGKTYHYLRYRDREGQHTRALGPIPLSQALDRAAQKTAELSKGVPRRESLGAVRALNRFVKHWEEVRRRSPKTVRFYQQKLGPLLAWMAARGGRMATWTPRLFERYVREHPSWSANTVRKVAVAARTFARWARRQNIACPDFAADFEGPMVTRPKKEAYTREEVRRVLDASKGRALEVPVALAFWAGLSDGDVRALTSDDIAGGWITRPRSKTRVPQIVPVATPLRTLLAGSDGPVCAVPASMSARWRQLCKAAGVPSRGGLKRLRISFATLLDAAGVSRGVISDLMGHTPRDVTSGYVRADRKALLDGIASLERYVNAGGHLRSPRNPK